jgi:putative ABC transport system ATP-binding protein
MNIGHMNEETTLIRCQNLGKRFQGRGFDVKAVEDVSMTLDEGEFLAIRGSSGSGKSTLLHMLGGLMRPDDGTVVARGEDLYALPVEARARFRARNIGFVFQQFHLIPYLSVEENIAAATVGLKERESREEIGRLLDRLGLAHRRRQVPPRLSVGERQRVSLARALVNRPKLLLADEPTGNLDPDNAERVLNHLSEFAAEGGGVILVTHDPEAAARASRSVRLEEGRLDVTTRPVADTG